MTGQRTLTRARAVILHQGRALLMKRIKPGMQYYALLGGKVEAGETPEQACVREVMEECGVTVRLGRELGRYQDVFEDILNTHFVYQCDYLHGQPALSGEELERSHADNYYEPLWVDFAEVSALEIKPEFMKSILLAAITEKDRS